MFNDASRGALHRHSNLVMSFEEKRNLLVPGAVQPVSRVGRARRWYVTATEIESRKQEEERIRRENVRLEERTRIAQELHDTLLQTFQSASLHLSAATFSVAPDSPVKNQLGRILEIIRQGIPGGRSPRQGLG